MPRQTNIQVRRGSISDWNTADPILNPGELGWDSSNKILKIGDGSNFWSHKKPISPYFSTYKTDIGDGVLSSFTVNHNLDATTETFVKVRKNSTGEQVNPDIKYVDKDNVLIEFASAPSVDEYSVTVVGIVSPSSEPSIVTNGLVLNLDAANTDSYPGSGTTWYDLSGNSNNGTLTNGPTFNSSDGGHFVFDGSNDYVNFSSVISTATANITMEIWFNQITSVAGKRLFYNGQSGSNGYGFYLGPCSTPGSRLSIVVGGVNCHRVYYTGISINNWYHCVYVRDGSNNNYLFINGSLVHTTSGGYNTPTGGSSIGANQVGSEALNCKVSSARLYHKALTGAEILQNYNANKDRFGL